MAWPQVFVTRRVPQDALDMLATETELEVWPGDEHPSREVMLDRASKCAAFLSNIEDEIDDELLLVGQGTLQVVANMAVGYDNFDIKAATRYGVALSNTPDILHKTTADLAFALLMAAARRITEADKDVRRGMWRNWHPAAYIGYDVHGATLGIVGLGQIGLEMAKRGRGFEMDVCYYSSTRHPDVEDWLGLTYCADLETILTQADFLSIHAPMNEDTRGMIGKMELRCMKSTAILINSARGPIVDNYALYEALRDGVIAGAGIDVTDPEPIPFDHPLLTLPNVVITPHIGSATLATRRGMALMAARNILDRLNDRQMETCLNPEVFNRC